MTDVFVSRDFILCVQRTTYLSAAEVYIPVGSARVLGLYSSVTPCVKAIVLRSVKPEGLTTHFGQIFQTMSQEDHAALPLPV